MLVKMNEMKNQKGFTLIELMIVIAIIGILAAIAIPQFSAYRNRGYDASAKADLNSIRTAEEAYYVDHDVYLAIAAGTTDPSATLPGTSALSAGNSVAVTSTDAFATNYIVTVISAKSGTTVTFTSSTGQTVTS